MGMCNHLKFDCEDWLTKLATKLCACCGKLEREDIISSVDKRIGKKCYMLGARELKIDSGDNPRCWRWKPLSDSRFPEVAELLAVNHLQLTGKIHTQLLSPNTTYHAYFSFKLGSWSCGFDVCPVKVAVSMVDSTGAYLSDSSSSSVIPRTYYLKAIDYTSKSITLEDEEVFMCMEDGEPVDRWLRIDMGKFFNLADSNVAELELTLIGTDSKSSKSGLIIHGELEKPKTTQMTGMNVCNHLMFASGCEDWLSKIASKLCACCGKLDREDMLLHDVGARALAITWGGNPDYWAWEAVPESRLPECAVLQNVCWLEIVGKIDTTLLSAGANYGAYFVFKMNDNEQKRTGFEDCPVKVSVSVVSEDGSERDDHETKSFYLINPESFRSTPELEIAPEKLPVVRDDGWMEIEMGRYRVGRVHDASRERKVLEMTLKEVERLHWKNGLIVQGIEVRHL